MESASALTSARIDLLPHQVVLTHRTATASPRRFLIADEVGLGKTIETALILRELASRGELDRALMVVPAGLVNNWHRELNEVFNLEFEVFGSEGDITDRKTNAFAKHDRLIASIDTLKRPARIKRLLDAPRWDLVVFDEAHHLTAYRTGGKVKKTENYKLAEALKGHTRDLILLGASVTVAARNPVQRAEAIVIGARAVTLDQLPEVVTDCDICLSAVPAPVVTAAIIDLLPKSAFLADFAAPPGGVDLDHARSLGINCLWGRALGRRAPITVGRSQWKGIAERIIKYVEERQ